MKNKGPGPEAKVSTDLSRIKRKNLLRTMTNLIFSLSLSMAKNQADFPWSPISPASHEEQLKVSATAPPSQPPLQQRKIIPVKTIDVADIQVNYCYEKMRQLIDTPH